ncbi:hypothetical protein K493DRAFT_345110 [Basidiobolus meristosporus CBS 931.73]|uniref:G-protein coupled receptors family 1 profile domain-containing protein n=1 Tax=Basidiobolus meristosporus CBS 931.73 TaxID=1314790 RepID=A0A1Y1Z4Y0_9FUNG|nr:hypothetical protein K493DRAFT_345110 [Basidiobolus meristosporus CBS 931.73]|eukprot:ORY05352.1 hypothetical protein K493DRAFT_345110 [Basidiobolus meristosporus CBS 931.73]
MKIRKPHIANRVSIGLTMWKAVADIFYSIVYLISQGSVVNLATCRFVLWGYVEFTLLSIFLTCAIAFNLQAIFVNELSTIIYVQRFYFPFTLALSLIISLIPLISGQFAYDPLVGNCWYREQYSTSTMIWEMSTFYGWIFLGIVYCSVAVALVTIRLIRNEREMQRNISPRATKIRRNINKVVTRIILYPVIPIVAQSFNFITELVTFYTRRLTFTLYFLSAAGPASIGFLNFLVFLFDPAFQKLVRELRNAESSSTQSSNHHEIGAKTGLAFESLYYLSEDGNFSASDNHSKQQHSEHIKLHRIDGTHQCQNMVVLESDSIPSAHTNPDRNSSVELILNSGLNPTTRPNNPSPYQNPEAGMKSNIVRYM